MNKAQRTKNEVENILNGYFKTSITEWHTDYNFTDNHGCDGYIFKSELAAVRFVYGWGLQNAIDFCNGACTDADWISILGGYVSERTAKRVIKKGDWEKVVKILVKNIGAIFFLSSYSGGITELSDGMYLYY